MLTYQELGIPEEHYNALKLVLPLLEQGVLVHVDSDEFDWKNNKIPNGFNMNLWRCDSVACIGGWAEKLSGVHFDELRDEDGNLGMPNGISLLFYPGDQDSRAYSANTKQAARALRNYLTYGDPQWKEVMDDV